MELGIGSMLRSSAFGSSAPVGVCSGECGTVLYATDHYSECPSCDKLTCTKCPSACCDAQIAESL